MLRRELDQLLHQLVVFALQVDLVDDLADPPHGPQLLDEGERLVLALWSLSLAGEVELCCLPPTLPVTVTLRAPDFL